MPRRRIPRLADAALITLLIALAGCGTSPNKEKEAVRLLGQLGGGELSATCSDSRGATELQRVMGEWMRSPHPADTLHQTRNTLVNKGDRCEKLAVTLAVEHPPALAEIQKLLGRESSTQTESVNLSGSQTDVTWHVFGWLHFGEVRGKVHALQVHFKDGATAGVAAKQEPLTPKTATFNPPSASFRSENAQTDTVPAVVIAHVRPEFFGYPPLEPYLGRTFGAEEYGGRSAVAILSHAYWSARFAADPGVIGRRVRLGERECTVVGVMPLGVDTPRGVAAWVPGH